MGYVLGPEAAYGLLGLAAVGLLWALFRREWKRFALWSLLLAVFTVPLGIMILSFRSDYFGLVSFNALGILSAVSLIWAYDFMVTKVSWKKPLRAMVAVLVVGYLGWGAWSNTDAINDETVLVKRADVAALAWIAEHTPQDARFFVNRPPGVYGSIAALMAAAGLLPTTGDGACTNTFYPYGMMKTRHTLDRLGFQPRFQNHTCGLDFWN